MGHSAHKLGLISVVTALLTACATAPDALAPAAAAELCHQQTADVFILEGLIDATLAACVRERFQPTTRELILRSPGGDVSSALDIAQLFEGRQLTMRVRQQCSSSCANYFLPLARRIIVEPGALIELHGSIDPWTEDRMLRRHEVELQADGVDPSEVTDRVERARVKFSALVERQAAFAERNRIPPGWLLYRTPGSDEVPGLSRRPTTAGRYLLVEEPMLRSCLPGVDIEPFQAELERRWLRSIRRLGLIWSKTVPSGQTICSAADS